MSGHSKWAGIKHKKAAIDAKRGKIFTKLIKEITVAAREGGGNPDANPRLRTAIQNAKAQNVPNDKIETSILRGTGQLPGLSYEEVTYEGYGPGGVAIIVEVVTDNKNRAISDMRYIFSKNGGNLGERGSVAWMFSKKGLITIDKDKANEDDLIAIALDAGAEDIQVKDDSYEIITTPDNFEAVKKAIDEAGIETVLAQVSMIPQTSVVVEGKEAHQVLKLMEALEDYDDTQNVYSNFDIADDILEKAAQEAA
ncbi:TPA: YebC/PmpR family DNA-binding transcriptional regulator [Candidatus Poribacteria bacterium]|nr:YebC/PmpR family DNA-binding transcriptional regulator [Candidatus Poribacteria bacterium]